MISLGVDIGGTGAKCVAFRDDGAQLALSYREYPNPPGKVNLEAEVLASSVVEVIRDCVDALENPGDVAAITVSSFGESFVPVDADRTRIRPVMTGDEAMDFIYCMDEIEAAWIANDKQREQKYKETLRSNDPADLVSIIKSLYRRGQDRIAMGKKVTATDERYFRQAEDTLYTELAFALEKSKDEVRALITTVMQEKRRSSAQG